MLTCPNCGGANPEGARFCNSCATPLQPDAAEPREERKVVTVLFADLVGFTSAAERLDPEDVRDMLGRYHGRLRDELTRLGGTVEKFIGDAVVGLFGAPTSHEDDPERAVRAALAIRDWVREAGSDLEVRIAVHTGMALVSLDARVAEGESMAAGDVVNTAARMQAAAPVNGILVGEETYRATRSVVEYEPRPPLAAKGRTSPVVVWEALRARSRVEVDALGGAPLVGRETELALLRDALGRAQRQREPQLVTLVGVPGIGKSRLVYELFEAVEASPELVFWRRGRSLPYGDGVTFWALAEVVKAQAGVLENDSATEAAEKLHDAVADLMGEEADGRWVEGHLRPLLGLATAPAGADGHQEAFSAWFRFVEALAERRPLVLALEDLHWANDALVDFVDELVDWASDIPLLILCTARPEFLMRRPEWGGGKPNAVTLSLPPLSEQETTALVESLLGAVDLAPDARAALLRHAGGNPLYAEEFVRLTQERGPGAEGRGSLPGSVQGLIAARLDALDPPEKRLLQDAAVAGHVFWVGAVAAIGSQEREDVERRLRVLERGEFVRRVRSPSVAGESEYAFRHVLVRDVAYGQIPRAQRAARHRLAAEWIERLGRPDDHAEMRAHHYLTAVELGRATGREDPELASLAWPALRAAGDRAMSLAAYEAAARFYEHALELCPEDDPEHSRLLLRHGRALRTTQGRGSEMMVAALEAFRSEGDREGVVEAASEVGQLLWFRGERDRAYEYADEAAALLAELPPSAAKATALLTRSGLHLVTAEFADALRLAREALAIVDELGLQARRPRALNLIGWSRLGTGDAAGLDDLQDAVEAALEPPFEHLHSSFENLRSAQFSLGLLAEASGTLARHYENVERLGVEGRRWVQVLRAADAYQYGRWDEALQLADAVLEVVDAGSPHYLEGPCRTLRAAIMLGRGELSYAGSDASQAIRVARRAKDDQVLSHALAAAAIVALAGGRREEADALTAELIDLPVALIFPMTFGWPTFADVAWLLQDLGRPGDLRRLVERAPVASRWVDAGRAIADGDPVAAAEVLAGMEHLPGEAEARLRAAEALLEQGDGAAGEAQRARALEIYRAVGASAPLRRAESLA